MIYADLFSRSEIFFFTVLFLVLYICLVPVFCMAQDTWMVVLLNFHLTHRWSVCLLLTICGKGHMICGDIRV